jgi:gamma-glutamyl:cysteine ligase YbdK (ATP-grasp superfamily)
MLPGADGRLWPVADLLDEAMELARPVARALGCAEELEGLTALTGQGGGAGLQHVAHREGGMGGLLRALTRRLGD